MQKPSSGKTIEQELGLLRAATKAERLSTASPNQGVASSVPGGAKSGRPAGPQRRGWLADGHAPGPLVTAPPTAKDLPMQLSFRQSVDEAAVSHENRMRSVSSSSNKVAEMRHEIARLEAAKAAEQAAQFQALSFKASQLQTSPGPEPGHGQVIWEEHLWHDGRIYYLNRMTREKQWNRPAAECVPCRTTWMQRQDSQSGRYYYFDEASKLTQWQPPQDFEYIWEERQQRNTGKLYYANRVTGATRWDQPPPLAAEGPGFEKLQ